MGMEKNNLPLVSLITPGWNGVSFVHRLLDSILDQTYSNIEYIYVDDGSTDGTKDVVLSYEQRFKERGISFEYVYKSNGGVSSAINEGLKRVKGDYLCWPEYDDILTPDSVEKRVRYLEIHRDCAVVTADAWLVNETDITKVTGVLSYHNPNRFDRNHFVQALMTNSIFTAACHMLRMSMFDEINPNRNIYPSWIGPNWQMLLPVYYKYNRGFIESPLVYYMIRSESISHSHTTLEQKSRAIDEYIRILKYVLGTINMPEEDRLLYNKMIDEKYSIDRMNLGLTYKDKQIFEKGYAYYSQLSDIPKNVMLLRKRFDCRFLNCFYAVVEKIIKKLKNIFL